MKRYHFLNGTWTENPKGIWVHYDDVEKARQQLKKKILESSKNHWSRKVMFHKADIDYIIDEVLK